MADCRIECLSFRQRQATGIGQEKAGWQVIRQFSAQGLDGPLRQDRNAVHSLSACRIIIKDHHLLRPLTACGTDGWARVIRPGWWEAVQDISQQQTRWVHAEIPSSGVERPRTVVLPPLLYKNSGVPPALLRRRLGSVAQRYRVLKHNLQLCQHHFLNA